MSSRIHPQARTTPKVPQEIKDSGLSDRQARRRAKLKAEGKAILPPVVVSQEVEQALAKFIQFKDMSLGDALDRIVKDRLLRKRSGKRKKKE